jgi:hypothetical protein
MNIVEAWNGWQAIQGYQVMHIIRKRQVRWLLQLSQRNPGLTFPGRYTKTPIFRSFWAAWRTLAGYEAIHMIRKGQACVSATGARVGLLHRLIVDMFGIEV